MTRRTLVLLLLFALPFALVTVVSDAEPAGACDCSTPSDAEAFSRADAVFVGELIGYAASAEPRTSLDPAVWTFTVHEVHKGDVAREQEVVSAISGASCGLEIPRHGTFLVFAVVAVAGGIQPAPGPGQLAASLCGGTRAVDQGDLDPALAAPREPVGVGTADRSSTPPRPGAAPHGGEPSRSLAAALVLGAVLVLGTVLVLWRGVRSRPRTDG